MADTNRDMTSNYNGTITWDNQHTWGCSGKNFRIEPQEPCGFGRFFYASRCVFLTILRVTPDQCYRNLHCQPASLWATNHRPMNDVPKRSKKYNCLMYPSRIAWSSPLVLFSLGFLIPLVVQLTRCWTCRAFGPAIWAISATGSAVGWSWYVDWGNPSRWSRGRRSSAGIYPQKNT